MFLIPSFSNSIPPQPSSDVLDVLTTDFGWNPETASFTAPFVDRVLLENQLAQLLPDPKDKEGIATGDSNALVEGGGKKRKRKGGKKDEDAGNVGGWAGPWAKPEIMPMGLTVRILEIVPRLNFFYLLLLWKSELTQLILLLGRRNNGKCCLSR